MVFRRCRLVAGGVGGGGGGGVGRGTAAVCAPSIWNFRLRRRISSRIAGVSGDGDWGVRD